MTLPFLYYFWQQPQESNLIFDDFGIMLISKSAELLSVDVKEEANAMLQELEGEQ